MIELTSLDNLPIFINAEFVETIEQQEEGTLISLASGKFTFVIEPAMEVSAEVNIHRATMMYSEEG